MSKHTPGPWRISSAPPPGVDLRIVAPCPSEQEPLGELFVAERIGARADARLMAASPDLLEALRWLQDWAWTDPDAPGDLFARDVARAAIAKAEGGE